MRPWFLSHAPSHPRVPQQTHKDTSGHLISSKNHGDVYQLRHEPALNSWESPTPAGASHSTTAPGLVRPNYWKPFTISLVLGTQGNSVTLRTLSTRMGRKCMSRGGHEDLMRRYIRHSLLTHRRELHSLLHNPFKIISSILSKPKPKQQNYENNSNSLIFSNYKLEWWNRLRKNICMGTGWHYP